MGLIENEEHFLLHCKEYKFRRSVLLSKINSTSQYNHNNSNNIVNLSVNNSSEFCLKLTSSYRIECLEVRNSMIS